MSAPRRSLARGATDSLRDWQQFVQLQQHRAAALFTFLGSKGKTAVQSVEAWRLAMTTETIEAGAPHPLNADPEKPSLPAHPANLDVLTQVAAPTMVAAGVHPSVVEAAVDASDEACRKLVEEFDRLAGTVPTGRGRLVELVHLFGEANRRLGRVRAYLCPPVPRAAATPPNPNDPRDRFIYEARRKGKSLAWIKAEVEARDKWEALTTIPGISMAARRYARRQGLSWPVNKR
jgi:hypothetical protein